MRDYGEAFRGVILGAAVGDALGLPREGLSRRRAMEMFGGAPLRHRLVFSHGMTSDDTEHMCMTARALLASHGDPQKFSKALSWGLRWWLLGLPAGVGLATARSILKLWIGFPPDRSGVWSAGNGPAMRAAIIGVYCASDLPRLGELIRVSSRMTHSDPAAEHGALAIALAAAYAVTRPESREVNAVEFLEFARPSLVGTPMLTLIEEVVTGVTANWVFVDYLKVKGWERGVTGYINHTVPACLFSWLSSPRNFRIAVENVILTGGDADSTGAIVGALVGISAGVEAIPPEWIAGLLEWPRTVGWMNRLAEALADNVANERGAGPVALFWPGLILRNLLFLCIVLVHGFRRLLPSY